MIETAVFGLAMRNEATNLQQYARRWSRDLELLRQNRLLDESTFIRFAKDRGLPAGGVTEGDPGDFHKRGWLRSDGTDDDGRPLFHPFRMYPLHRTLQRCSLGIQPSQSLRPNRMMELVKHLLSKLPALEEFEEAARRWNLIVDLALLAGIERAARLKLDRLEAATALGDLAILPGNRFEALAGDRKGLYSIRINDQWRICFEWPQGVTGPSNVEIVDYH